MQEPLKMRDPTREFSFNLKIITFFYAAFIQPITMQKFIRKDLA